MDNQNHNNLGGSKPKQGIIYKIATWLMIIVVLNLGKFWLADRCSIIKCKPATWNQIQEIIIKDSTSWGIVYLLDHISVFPIINAAGDIEKIRYVVYYVSTKWENSSRPSIYPIKQINFDDQNLWIARHEVGYFSKPLPTTKNLEELKYVISPEKAIELTNDLARKVVGQTGRISLKLTFLNEEAAIISNWEVTYFGSNNEQFHLLLDAQSGKIIEKGSDY
jgi:hypothetical protein